MHSDFSELLSAFNDHKVEFLVSMTPTNEDRDRVIAEIEEAFDGVSREDGITLHEADAIDSHASEDELQRARDKDCESRWQDVPDAAIEGGADSLAHFDAKGLRYYLPAYMRWTIRHGADSRSVSSDFVIYTLARSVGSGEYFEERIAGFTPAQCRAICRFLHYIVASGEPDFERDVARKALADHWGQFCYGKE